MEAAGSARVSRPVSTRGLAAARCVRAATRSWIAAQPPSAARHCWHCDCVVLANSQPSGTYPVLWEEDLAAVVGSFGRLDVVWGWFGSGFEGRQWGWREQQARGRDTRSAVVPTAHILGSQYHYQCQLGGSSFSAVARGSSSNGRVREVHTETAVLCWRYSA